MFSFGTTSASFTSTAAAANRDAADLDDQFTLAVAALSFGTPMIPTTTATATATSSSLFSFATPSSFATTSSSSTSPFSFSFSSASTTASPWSSTLAATTTTATTASSSSSTIPGLAVMDAFAATPVFSFDRTTPTPGGGGGGGGLLPPSTTATATAASTQRLMIADGITPLSSAVTSFTLHDPLTGEPVAAAPLPTLAAAATTTPVLSFGSGSTMAAATSSTSSFSFGSGSSIPFFNDFPTDRFREPSPPPSSSTVLPRSQLASVMALSNAIDQIHNGGIPFTFHHNYDAHGAIQANGGLPSFTFDSSMDIFKAIKPTKKPNDGDDDDDDDDTDAAANTNGLVPMSSMMKSYWRQRYLACPPRPFGVHSFLLPSPNRRWFLYRHGGKTIDHSDYTLVCASMTSAQVLTDALPTETLRDVTPIWLHRFTVYRYEEREWGTPVVTDPVSWTIGQPCTIQLHKEYGMCTRHDSAVISSGTGTGAQQQPGQVRHDYDDREVRDCRPRREVPHWWHLPSRDVNVSIWMRALTQTLDRHVSQPLLEFIFDYLDD